MKKGCYLFTVLMMIISLASCTRAGVIPTSLSVTHPTNQSTPTRPFTPHPTGTAFRDSTHQISISPTQSSTHDPLSVVATTFTPDNRAICPQGNKGFEPVFVDQKIDGAWYQLDLSGPLLEALNNGASLQTLRQAVSKATGDGKAAEIPPESLYSIDVTGDTIPEIIYSHSWLIIYSCKGGKYVEIYKQRPGTTTQLQKEMISDVNFDGTNEIILSINELLGFVSNNFFSILHWNGNEFVDLIEDPDFDIPGDVTWSLQDIDGNGTLSLVIRSNRVMSGDDRAHGPWRDEIYTYRWNGNVYAPGPMQLDPPEYRFQAVQDGDRAMRREEYTSAIKFFRQAIDDPNLKGWGYSLEHNFQRMQALDEYYQGTPTQTPLPPDPNEKPNLIAYSHFRLVLAYMAIDDNTNAKTTYDALNKLFPTGLPGDAYVNLARKFWDSFQQTESLPKSCLAVVEYVEQHEEEILQPVNNYLYGFQNLSYSARDLCLP